MSLKKEQARARYLKEQELLKKCSELTSEKIGAADLSKLKEANRGLYYLPVTNDKGEVVKVALMKPSDAGMFKKCQDAFIKEAMRLGFVAGDKDIIENEEYFIQAASTFNKILEGKYLKCQ